MTARVVLLVTSPRVPVGLLSSAAWALVQAGPVHGVEPGSPAWVTLAAAGAEIHERDDGRPVEQVAQELVAAARRCGTVAWWVGPGGDEALAAAMMDQLAPGSDHDGAVELELLHGSWDLPGARLLDVVATMDRLRSPNGCPWDARQDHESLAKYLLEEAYEAFQAIEDADPVALREELGDVLLQVAFHARLAEELPGPQRWTIDDVAVGLVDKLVRRHPHVFDGLQVSGVDEVNTNWEAIKAAERGGASPLANVPMAAAALTLAATLQRKAARIGAFENPTEPLSAVAGEFQRSGSAEAAGELLWAVVAAMRALDIDAESALRAKARRFRDQLTVPAGEGAES